MAKYLLKFNENCCPPNKVNYVNSFSFTPAGGSGAVIFSIENTVFAGNVTDYVVINGINLVDENPPTYEVRARQHERYGLGSKQQPIDLTEQDKDILQEWKDYGMKTALTRRLKESSVLLNKIKNWQNTIR